MTYNEALIILSLSSNFSEEELKKAYHKAMRQYHPDYYENKNEEDKKHAEEMSKKINEAYDILKNRTNIFDMDDHAFNISIYKRNLSNKLSDLKKVDKQLLSKDNLSELAIRINMIITSFTLTIIHTNKKKIIDDFYKDTKNAIKTEYINYQEYFFRKYNINIANLNISINYDVSIEDFYKQLISIRGRFSNSVKFKRRIEAETEQYKYFAGYETERMRALIKAAKENAMIEAERNSYNNLDGILSKMNRQILNDFKTHFELQKEIDNLFIRVREMEIFSLELEWQLLKESYNKGLSSEEVKKIIEKLKVHIDLYTKNEEGHAPISDLIEKTTRIIYAKYSAALENIPTYIDEKTDLIKKEYIRLMDLLGSISRGLESVDKLSELTNYDFNDILTGKINNDHIKYNQEGRYR